MGKKNSFTTSIDGDLLLNNFIEINMDPVLLNNFSNEEGMGAYFNSYASSEEFQKLRADLIQEVFIIIEEFLTSKQKEVVYMTYVDGKTQNEISIELGKHQTTIHKILRGNIDYSNDKKRYGGALKKIKKKCKESRSIQKILKQMRDTKFKTNY